MRIVMRRDQMSEKTWAFLHSFEGMLAYAEGMSKKEIRSVQVLIEEMMVPYANNEETKQLDLAIINFLGLLSSTPRKTVAVKKGKKA